jgi:hypothetical protein
VASGRRARPFLVGLLAPGSSGSICALLTVAIAAPVASTPPEARETGLSFVLFGSIRTGSTARTAHARFFAIGRMAGGDRDRG